MTLQQCSKEEVNNGISIIEQSLTIRDAIVTSPLISTEGDKIQVIAQIIRIIEFYLTITRINLEVFQIRILASDLYTRFKHDSIDDIVLLFKMIRTNELGKVGYTESFHEKTMLYVDKYFDYKSEQREKLIELKKRKLKKEERQQPISAEGMKKLEELRKKIADPIQERSKGFSISNTLSSLDAYLETLPETSKNLSDGDLKYELNKTMYQNKAAYQILLEEQERRKELKTKKR